jgi:hypothetical protein
MIRQLTDRKSFLISLLRMAKGATRVNEYLFPGKLGKYYRKRRESETDYTHTNPRGARCW